MNDNLMIVAGEASGDLHGASLIDELKKRKKNISVYGIGGDKMKNAGMDIIYHINKMAFLGFAEVVRHIPFIKRVQNDLIHIIKEKNIKDVVLIDYPGFNLNFAKKLKDLNIKVIYYISPQIWAWGAGRIKKIKKLVDKMIVLFPFEEEMYKKENINVEFVGHPLLERISEYNFLSKEDFYKKFGLDESKEILLILPGSRNNEVVKILPEVFEAAKKLSNEFNLQIVIAGSENIDDEIFKNLNLSGSYKIIKGLTYDLMKHSKIGIIKSGTSTLEAGLFELPSVIVYRTSFLSYLIGKNLIKIKDIAMANIILGERILPELIQDDVSKDLIYSECKKILSNKTLYGSIKEKLKNIKMRIGTIGASGRAADSIIAMMNES